MRRVVEVATHLVRARDGVRVGVRVRVRARVGVELVGVEEDAAHHADSDAAARRAAAPATAESGLDEASKSVNK